MFTLHPHEGQHGATEAQPHELHTDHSSASPLNGELLDLYAAILIVVPLALFLRSFLL